jgi:hypothetical protein
MSVHYGDVVKHYRGKEDYLSLLCIYRTWLFRKKVPRHYFHPSALCLYLHSEISDVENNWQYNIIILLIWFISNDFIGR